ncbi:MAG: hypothetical protein M3347_18370 [Armatimonadota bacterium]|nr:hypothetical protein [Armatimonadota bacterium]
MVAHENIPSPAMTAPVKSKGQVYEGIAFNFCKAATIILFTGPYALLVASGAATIFYLLAHRHGQTDTRCVLKRPLLIAVFWGSICLARLYFHLLPVLNR